MSENIILESVEFIINRFNQIEDWDNGEFSIIAGSGLSPSFKYPQFLKKQNSEIIVYDYFTLNNSEYYPKLFKKINIQNKINKITFIFKNREFTDIIKSWDQSVQDEFEQYLPKSKKGKIRAWYLPAIEAAKVEEPVKLVLPKPEVIFNLEYLTLDKAYEELNKIVIYKNDPLWDGGYYGITHNEDGWSGYAGLYLYDSIEDKKNKLPAEDQELELNITEDIKKLFLYIQNTYNNNNPDVRFDSLFVTVQQNGIDYTRNFELDGEEIYPDAPAITEEITADYLLQNLENCLITNAPENYEWACYRIRYNKNAEGITETSGDYYYTLNADKTNMQPLEPGDEIYMQNVTMRLMDEFWDKEEQNWKEVIIFFSKKGDVLKKIIK